MPAKRQRKAIIELPAEQPRFGWAKDEIAGANVGAPSRDRSEIVRDMKRERNWPRSISGEKIVPRHVAERYSDIWHREHQALLREEAIRAAYTLPAIMRRIYRRFVDIFAGRHR